MTSATLTRDGTLTARITVRNSSDAPHTGELTLSSFIVQGGGLPYDGSVLTPSDPVLLEQVVTVPARDSLDFDLDLAMLACADDVLPLPTGEYGLEAIVTLSPGGEPLGFSSPTFTIIVD